MIAFLFFMLFLAAFALISLQGNNLQSASPNDGEGEQRSAEGVGEN